MLIEFRDAGDEALRPVHVALAARILMWRAEHRLFYGVEVLRKTAVCCCMKYAARSSQMMPLSWQMTHPLI